MTAAPLLVGIESTVLGEAERAFLEGLRPAGYLLLPRNLETPFQTRTLTDALREIDPGLEPVIAIAEEGGSASPINAFVPSIPSPADLAARGQPAAIADCGAFTADLLRLLGINLNLAPLLDLDLHPDTAGTGRRWHRDCQRVIDHAGMWNRWLRKHKVRSAAKSFPAGGRGPRAEVTVAELLAADIIPYTALMPELDAVIVGHQILTDLDPRHPACLSRRIVTSLLRNQLGFDDHLVLTDDLSGAPIGEAFADGAAAPAALGAGCDLAVIAADPSLAARAAARLGEAPAPLLHDADRRIERFRKRLHDPLPWSEERWTATCAKLPREPHGERSAKKE